MPGRDALSPLFLSADTCTGTMVQAVCIFVLLSVFFVTVEMCQFKCMNISLSVCLCVSYVHMGDTEPVQPHWKQQLFSTVQIKVRKEAQ